MNVGFSQSIVPNPMATGGYSTVFVRPSYQHGVRNVVGRWRGIPDVSMSAPYAAGVGTIDARYFVQELASPGSVKHKKKPHS